MQADRVSRVYLSRRESRKHPPVVGTKKIVPSNLTFSRHQLPLTLYWFLPALFDFRLIRRHPLVLQFGSSGHYQSNIALTVCQVSVESSVNVLRFCHHPSIPKISSYEGECLQFHWTTTVPVEWWHKPMSHSMRPLIDLHFGSDRSRYVPFTITLSKPPDAASATFFASLFGCTDFHEVRRRQGMRTSFSP